jgi:tetratricopeptide (TPR) repeat protein
LFQFLAAFSLLGLFAWSCIQVYGARSEPSRVAEGQPPAWFRSDSTVLAETGRARVKAGLESLATPDLPGKERVGRYRARLEQAERLFVASLRQQPAQAETLAQLAAVRWELDPPMGQLATEQYVGMIELASRMAPTVPRVQLQLGELLLKMGRNDAALGYFRRSLDLDPQASRRIVGTLNRHLYSADEILGLLPNDRGVLVALEPLFSDEQQDEEYLVALEQALAAGPPTTGLLRVTANTCLRLDRPQRLLALTEEVGELTEPRAEAERLFARSRAGTALGNHDLAIADARRASRLAPSNPLLVEHLGSVLDRAEQPEAAIKEFRRALRLLAHDAGNPVTRGRLYRKIGRSEERRGDAMRAYDAYKMAVNSNPQEAFAKRRLAEMERAAGIVQR